MLARRLVLGRLQYCFQDQEREGHRDGMKLVRQEAEHSPGGLVTPKGGVLSVSQQIPALHGESVGFELLVSMST